MLAATAATAIPIASSIWRDCRRMPPLGPMSNREKIFRARFSWSFGVILDLALFCFTRWPRKPVAMLFTPAAGNSLRKTILIGSPSPRGFVAREKARPPTAHRHPPHASTSPTAPRTPSTLSTPRPTKLCKSFAASSCPTALTFLPTAPAFTSAMNPRVSSTLSTRNPATFCAKFRSPAAPTTSPSPRMAAALSSAFALLRARSTSSIPASSRSQKPSP